jgi:hypothetical protein
MGRGYQISDMGYQEDKEEKAYHRGNRGAAEDAEKARQE